MELQLDLPAPVMPTTQAVRVAIAVDHTLVRAAIAHLIDTTDDLVIADTAADATIVVIDLDVVDDAALAEARRLADRTPAPGIVALTVSTDAERLAEALRAGVAAIVSTQSPAEELLRAIRTVVAGDMYFDPRTADVIVSQLRERRNHSPQSSQRRRFGELSEREQSVLRLVAEGHTGPEIGRLLGITAKTVDTYRHRIQQKIGLTHRRDYVHFALRIGLLEE